MSYPLTELPEVLRVAHQFVGVDAHKRSVTVAVVDAVGGELAAASFANSSHGVEEVAVWLHAAAPAVLRIGVEGSSGHGRHLAQRLVAAGYDVWEVPPRRTEEDGQLVGVGQRGRRGAEAGPGQTRCRAWRGPR